MNYYAECSLSLFYKGNSVLADFEYIKKNLDGLLAEIDALSSKHGNKVTLVAVTKSGSDDELVALAEYGAINIGENRPQELRRRGDLLREREILTNLHEIGNLQRNKVKLIAESVSLIHSLDSIELAREIDKQAERFGRVIPVLVEVNSAGESQKGGVLPDFVEDFCHKVRQFPNISLCGLMTMGPVCDEPEEIRPYFRAVRGLFDKLKSDGLFDVDGILSMGMSDSYKVAIEEGSTLVRVGRRLFIKD